MYIIVKSVAASVAKWTTKVNMVINSDTSINRKQQNQNLSRESLYTEMTDFQEIKNRREFLMVRGVSDEEFSQTFINLS